jgi:hypothetical protein
VGFQHEVAADLEAVLDLNEWAVELTYTPADGSGAKTLSAIVEYGTDGIADAQDGRNRTRRATVHISRDATAGIPSPHPNDTLTIETTVWAVEAILSMDEAGATLSIIRSDPIRKTGQGRTLERS